MLRIRHHLAPLIVVVGLLIAADSTIRRRKGGEGGADVVIIDPLAPLDLEGGFTARCVSLFESAGFSTEVYMGSEVTVDRLKALSRGCAAIVFRVHSGVFQDRVWFFTGERYDDTIHVAEQLAYEVHIARTSPDTDLLFAVGAKFVRRYMAGRLGGALVILMGCDGLASEDLAEAFVDAGASAYVSWDGPVSLPHTDEATLALIEGMASEGACLGDAVERSRRLVGDDETYESSLAIFPDEGALAALRGNKKAS